MFFYDSTMRAAQALHAPLFAAMPELYYVGGCVRNGLLRQPVDDYDFACPHPPDAIDEALKSAGIKTAPTGIAHGTVTAIIKGIGHEITSFRTDVRTDGRHAEVIFGGTLEQDAQRRDFTMNALYARADGEVLDPVGGLPDLEKRYVRFIGEPAARISEDYLRVLRFFRFYAGYGQGDPDKAALAACAAAAGDLGRLSRERVGKEIMKMLALPAPGESLSLMQQTGVWPALFGADLPAFGLINEKAGNVGRLAWLLPSASAEEAQRLLRLSNQQTAHFRQVRALLSALPESVLKVRLALQTYTPDAVHDALHLSGQASDDLLNALNDAPDVFPVTGQDLLALGVKPGKELGSMLQKLREAWLAGGMEADREALLQSFTT